MGYDLCGFKPEYGQSKLVAGESMEQERKKSMTIEQKIKYIADYYGYEPQSRQLIEEMAELTVALNKAWRKTFDTVDKIPNMDDEECIVEEIADVKIMITQIEYLLGVSAMELDNMVNQKLDRQIERIKTE